MKTTNSAYCSMIHGGLALDSKRNKQGFVASHCCLLAQSFDVLPGENIWKNVNFIPLREKNKTNKWSPGCYNCLSLESSGKTSMRQGMNIGLDANEQTDLSGPVRLDLMFDVGCNLACRTCGPQSSTFWQKHLLDNKLSSIPVSPTRRSLEVIEILDQVDLSNLRQVVFCGGETLLGQEYWNLAEWLVNKIPNAKNQLTLCFQTNGTQPILEKNYSTIEKTFLTKLHVSLDGFGKRFEYLRWPASWSETTDNILEIRESCPSNVMFVIEETISIFNLFYLDEVAQWHQQHFNANREGDIVDYSNHLATGIFSLNNLSQEYVDSLLDKNLRALVPATWKENPKAITNMLAEINQFDNIRGQSFEKIFPEVAKMYQKF